VTHGRICRSEMKMNLEKDELMDESKLIDCICVDEMNGLSPCHFFFKYRILFKQVYFVINRCYRPIVFFLFGLFDNWLTRSLLGSCTYVSSTYANLQDSFQEWNEPGTCESLFAVEAPARSRWRIPVFLKTRILERFDSGIDWWIFFFSFPLSLSLSLSLSFRPDDGGGWMTNPKLYPFDLISHFWSWGWGGERGKEGRKEGGNSMNYFIIEYYFFFKKEKLELITEFLFSRKV